MPLTLTLTGAHGPAGNERRTLAEGNLAIGRSPDNGWGLPGPAGFAHPLVPPPPPSWRNDDPFDSAEQAGHSSGVAGFDDDDLLKPRAPVDVWQGGPQADNADAPAHAFTAPRAIAPANLDD